MKKISKKDFLYRRKHLPETPFAEWLKKYSEAHHISMATMALEAGLPRSLLNTYISDPVRKPSYRTILKLSESTGTSADEIARLAGIPGYQPSYKPTGDTDPSIDELLNAYKRLPPPMQQYVLRTVHTLGEAAKTLKPHRRTKQEEVKHD